MSLTVRGAQQPIPERCRLPSVEAGNPAPASDAGGLDPHTATLEETKRNVMVPLHS